MPLLFLRRKFISYIQEFIHDSRAIGIILFLCTAFSMILANTPWGKPVIDLVNREWHWLHYIHVPHSALHLVNDGLMAVFFFLVGLEIKRELEVGELSTLKRAMLPIGAAIGGMAMPALLYLLYNKGSEFQQGWGIPTATDIAFSLGVASMLGKKFPLQLKIFLTALAIIDDLGAILVIALFYGGEVKLSLILLAVAMVFLISWLNRKTRKFGALQIIGGLLLWYIIFNSGIHATIAGVVLAFLVPTDQIPDLESKLHNFVNFGILPLFALANTLIVLQADMLSAMASTLSLGIIVGLVVGKPLGIFLACRIMVRRKLADLPRGVTWSQIMGAGILAGIGFTMSIFIASLAFRDHADTDTAKIAILTGLVITVVLAFVWFFLIQKIKSSSKAG